MRFQYIIVTTMVAAFFCAPAAKAQSAPIEATLKASLLAEENKESNIRPDASAGYLKSESSHGRLVPSANFHKKRFVFLSTAVYTASLADMHQTLRMRSEQWWFERDPLARPVVRLPAPAYYATGLALATGVNWLSWKMGHWRRWHKMACLPQLFAIAGNGYGFKSNHFGRY